MAKKLDATFDVEICKNTEKGGAWLATYTITKDGLEEGYVTEAWSNASAAKRWIKAAVIAKTPRKSVKLEVTAMDANNKPTCIKGQLIYKVDA